MKAKKLLAMTAIVALGAAFAAGCAPALTDAALTGSTVADFGNGQPDEKVLFASDGWSNGSVFNTVWTSGNLTYSDGAMHLGIKEEAKTVYLDGKETPFRYTSGEARTTYYYGYGDYEVRMKPSATVGTASTFFVCTGPYDKTPEGVENPWDEIDIEFLGKSTNKVQFNYFANGTGGHEHMFDLGFDASKEFHNYGFRWAEDYITWFVDGKPVYRVDKKTGEDFPKTAGRMLMNYWCGTEDAEGWMGKFAGPDGKTADYAWVKTSAAKVNPPMGDPYPDKPDTPPTPSEGGELDWSKTEALELGFADSDPFTVVLSEDKLSADVTYTAAKGASYTNIEMPAPAAAADADLAHFKIKNNGEAEVYLRISLVNNEKDAENAASGYTKNSDVNVSATMDGTAVDTNLVNGGSYFTIPVGAEVECVIKFEGVVDRIQLMPDTSKWDDTATHAGNLHVSELKFGVTGTQGGETPDPVVPEGEPVALTFNVEENAGYTMTAGADNKSWTLAYAGKGNTYKPVTADCAALAAGKNTFTITIKNNKDTAVTVRVDVQGTTSVPTGEGSNTDCTNRSATCTGGTELYTDLQWGGTKVTLAAGEEVTLVITYDETKEQGAVRNILVFVDSMGGDENDHDANVTVSGFLFTKQD